MNSLDISRLEAPRRMEHGWPEARANLSFIAPEKIAPVPVLELTGVSAGEVFEYSIPEDKEVTFLLVTLAPADAVEGVPSLVGVRLRDSMDRYGAGLAVTGVRGEACRVRLPGGTWRIELEWEHGAVTDFGECVVTGDQPIDLGPAAPAPWSYLELPLELAELNLLQIYFETDAVDFVVYDSKDPSETFPKESRLCLPTGTYVVRTQTAAGRDVKEQRIELRAGEGHSLQPVE